MKGVVLQKVTVFIMSRLGQNVPSTSNHELKVNDSAFFQTASTSSVAATAISNQTLKVYFSFKLFTFAIILLFRL